MRGAGTRRAAVLGLVVCAIVLTVAYPLREYFAQRGTIATLESAQQSQERRVRDLEEEQRRLADPAYIAAQARERLHFVRPGETNYVVLAPAPDGGAVADRARRPAVDENAPWYSRLWQTVEAAGREQPATPPPVPAGGAVPAP